MKHWRWMPVGLAAGLLLWTGTAVAQQSAPYQAPAGNPDRVEGQVVKIDRESKKVTVQGAGGRVYEFAASDETLKDLKVGDRIEAKLRQPK